MEDIVIASNEADLRSAEAVEAHHAELSGALAVHVQQLLRGEDPDADRVALLAWCRRELVPHALAEEQAMYPAAATLPEGRLLVEAMLADHRTLVALVNELAMSGDERTAVGTARALQVLFEAHLAKENQQLLPLLLRSPGVSVAALLGSMHEVLGGHRPHGDVRPAGGQEAHGHACGCDEGAEPEPELDARAVPHAIRHATIFGALDAVRVGSSLVLVAPHDPLPLLAQLERRAPDAFAVDYVERGPEAWRLRFRRRLPTTA